MSGPGAIKMTRTAIVKAWRLAGSTINEYSDLTRRAANESNEQYPELQKQPNAPVVASALHQGELVETANRLLAVFTASPNPQAIAEQLNQLLAHGEPRLTAVANDRVERGYLIDRSRSPLVAASALVLLDFVETHGIERLGCCAANNCADVFIDHSQRRNRNYCSETCQTRERVARHRRNKR